jgi:hypothetical protein
MAALCSQRLSMLYYDASALSIIFIGTTFSLFSASAYPFICQDIPVCQFFQHIFYLSNPITDSFFFAEIFLYLFGMSSSSKTRSLS